jgi:hypothetical protein
MVSNHLKLRNLDSKLKASRKYANKKNAGIVLVQDWLESNHVKCPSKFKRMLESSTKKDDLCDSMMIGVSWVQMMANAKRFIAES